MRSFLLLITLLFQRSEAFLSAKPSFSATSPTIRTSTAVQSSNSDQKESDASFSRRNLFEFVATAATTSILSNPELVFAADDETTASPPKKKVLVLGGTGFVGSEVCKKLSGMGIDYVATSRDGRDGTIALDFSDKALNVSTKIEGIAKDFGCTAVISCIGAIGTVDDQVVNSGTGLAAMGAKTVGSVQNFVYVSVAPEVRASAKGISFLKNYMDGKQFSEDSIKSSFADGYTIIAPTFIYGGDKFAINPPRVASGYGKLVESLLSSGPFRFAAEKTPGLISVALEPPVNVKSVAEAAIAGALGLSEPVLDTYDKINKAAGLVL